MGLLDDFPERLRRFKEASGLSWAEIARRLGTTPKTVRRWYQGKGRPNAHYLLALQDLAKSLGLGHMLTGQEGRGDTRPGHSRPATVREAARGRGMSDKRLPGSNELQRKRPAYMHGQPVGMKRKKGRIHSQAGTATVLKR